MRPPDRFAPFITFILLSIVVAVLYAPGLRGAYYGDDLMFVRPLHGHFLAPFLHANRETGWYRPIEATLLGAIQDRFGLDTTPIHVLAILLHALVGLLVARLALRMGLGRSAALAAALVFAISQACASAVLGNDTLSQLLATAFGLGGVVLVAGSATRGAGESDVPRALLGALCVLMAMLSKEAGIGWAAAAALAAIVAARAGEGRASRAILPVALIVLTVAGYLLLRDVVGARPVALGHGRYDLAPGVGILVRLGMLLGVTVLPVSTVLVASAWSRADLFLLASAAVIEAAIVACLCVGLSRRPKLGLLLVAGATLALAPVLMIRHVSELYAYTAMPFAAIALGAVAAGALGSAHGARRAVFAVAICAFAFHHVLAVREKARYAAGNGEKATRLLADLEPVIASAPRGGSVLLVERPGLPQGYSVYTQEGFAPVEFAESYLLARTGRNDVRVRVVTPAEADTLAARPDVSALAIVGRHPIPYVPGRWREPRSR